MLAVCWRTALEGLKTGLGGFAGCMCAWAGGRSNRGGLWHVACRLVDPRVQRRWAGLDWAGLWRAPGDWQANPDAWRLITISARSGVNAGCRVREMPGWPGFGPEWRVVGRLWSGELRRHLLLPRGPRWLFQCHRALQAELLADEVVGGLRHLGSSEVEAQRKRVQRGGAVGRQQAGAGSRRAYVAALSPPRPDSLAGRHCHRE